ncbi:MAG: hypothetical protein PVJ47_05165, partial [Thiohalocapsa sp.]
PAEAQRLADSLDATALHRHLDAWARRCCPVVRLQPRRPAPTDACRPERYLAFMACLDNPNAAQKALAKMAAPAKVKDRSFRGFDLFLDPDYRLFLTLARGEWSISGFRAGDLRAHIAGLTPARASYLIKRLRTHGLIKKVAHTYKYFFTKLGRRVVVTALVIREYFVQPSLVRAALWALHRFVEGFGGKRLSAHSGRCERRRDSTRHAPRRRPVRATSTTFSNCLGAARSLIRVSWQPA